MNTPASSDVIVVGGGPAGSATAMLLAARGHSVTLLDRARFPRDKACSEFMSPAATEALQRIGVLGALEREPSARPAALRISTHAGHALVGCFSAAPVAPWRSDGLALRRDRLDACLLEAAADAGVRVCEGWSFDGVVREHDAVTGVVAHDRRGVRQELRAPLTVGADGLRSLVARCTGGLKRGRRRRIAFVAHLTGVADLQPGQAEMHVFDRGYAGLNPLGDSLVNAALVVPAGRAGLARGRADQFLLDTLRQLPALEPRLRRVRFVRRTLVTGPFAQRARSTIDDGIALVGDAAEFHDPFTGDGIHMALRGAELLAPVVAAALARGDVSVRALSPYRRARHRAFTGKRVVERLLALGIAHPGCFAASVRAIARRPALAHTVVGISGGFVPLAALLRPGLYLLPRPAS
ncbi:MAG TPA: NAD(P)/FAD-dependent oxidoreductase [Gemmatimonadales bacterium]|nr:NAD(P)/FAD-dependent oxidoreductase [Gemmatimonadales bacterium]